MPVSFVTPSTRPAISSPNASRTSSSEAAGVLHRVVQQRRAQRLRVEAHAGADLRHADRVGDEVLAGLAALVGVVLAGEDERLADALAVDLADDLVGVLLDDREQVGEQRALELGEVGRRVRRRRVRVILAIDRRVARRPRPGGARGARAPRDRCRRPAGWTGDLLVLIAHACPASKGSPAAAPERAPGRSCEARAPRAPPRGAGSSGASVGSGGASCGRGIGRDVSRVRRPQPAVGGRDLAAGSTGARRCTARPRRRRW